MNTFARPSRRSKAYALDPRNCRKRASALQWRNTAQLLKSSQISFGKPADVSTGMTHAPDDCAPVMCKRRIHLCSLVRCANGLRLCPRALPKQSAALEPLCRVTDSSGARRCASRFANVGSLKARDCRLYSPAFFPAFHLPRPPLAA